MFYNDVISKKRHNPKELWNFIKSMIPSNHLTPSPNILDINRTSVEDPILISEFFNNYFVNIGQTIAESTNSTNNQSFKTYLGNSVSQSIILDSPQPNKIYNIINSLNLN